MALQIEYASGQDFIGRRANAPGTLYSAQTFTPNASFDLTSISLLLGRKSAFSANVSISFYTTDVSGHPDIYLTGISFSGSGLPAASITQYTYQSSNATSITSSGLASSFPNDGDLVGYTLELTDSAGYRSIALITGYTGLTGTAEFDEGGLDTGNDPAGGNNSFNLFTTSPPEAAWETRNVSGINFTTGVTYAILFSGSGTNDTTYPYWAVDSGGGYVGGNQERKFDGVWSSLPGDFLFKIYGSLASPPSKATNPTPADDATRVDFSGLTLSWDDGGGADTFDVYMGPVGNLSLISSAQAGTSKVVDTADVPWGETIYWRIDSTNADGTTTGDTWSFDTVIIRSVKLGANGAFIVVTAKDGVYLSTDSGANWTRKTPDAVEDTDWVKGICSSNGSYIIVVSSADAIYRSANSGTSWATITPAGGDTFSVNKMATSDDGQFMVIVGQNSTDATESCYISTDYGATWIAKKPVAASIEWTECDISNDGAVIAVSTSSYFYVSFDSGTNWTEQGMASSAEVWNSLSISGDGTIGLVTNTNQFNEFFIGIKTNLYSEATWAESVLTSAGRAILDDATVADQNTTLGFGIGDSPTLTGLTLSAIAAEATDVDKFLVDSTGVIKYRTGAEVLADIGASASSHLHDTQTLQHDAVNSDGGAFSFTTTGLVTFNQSIAAANYTAAALLTACTTNAGALDFSAASKTLTVEDSAIVSQDYSSDASPTFAGLTLSDLGGGNTLLVEANASGVLVQAAWRASELVPYIGATDDVLFGNVNLETNGLIRNQQFADYGLDFGLDGGLQFYGPTDDAFYPDVTNDLLLGKSDKRWKTIYGVDGDFSGDLDVDGDITAGEQLISTAADVGIDLTGCGTAASFHNLVKLSAKTFGVAGSGSHFSGFNRVSGAEFFTIAAPATSTSIFGGAVDGDTWRRFIIFASGQIRWGTGGATHDIQLQREGVIGGLGVLELGSSVANSSAHFKLNADGKLMWGASFLGFDVELHRQAANILATEDSFVVGANLTVDTNTLFVDSANDRVGIGTTTPDYILDIDAGEIGDNNYDGLRIVDTGWDMVSHPMLEFYNSHASFNGSLARIYGEIGILGENSKLYFAVADSSKSLQDRMVIDKGGNVGIGLTTVDANYKLIIRRAANINLGIGLQSSELAIAAFNDALSANIPMRFYASEYNLLNGSVGINTETPDAKLQVVGNCKFGDDNINYASFSSTGDLSFTGTATTFSDIFFPMTSGKLVGANQPDYTTAVVGNINEYTFAINDYIDLGAGEISHSYKEGSDFNIHCHIITNGLDGTDRYARYSVEYIIADVDGVVATATLSSIDLLIPASTTDRTHLRFEIGVITGTNYKINGTIKIQFKRIALIGGGSAPSSDPFVTMVGIHIEEDTVGSRTQSVK